MKNEEKKKPEIWRIVVFIATVVLIAFLWIKNDVARLFLSANDPEALPLATTTVAVSLLKTLIVIAGIMLIKLIIGWVKKRK